MPHEDHYQQKLGKIIEKKPLPPDIRMWIHVLIYSFFITALLFVYQFATAERFSTRLINQSIANAGMILIGLSFALSGLCYFWNFADHFIIYRKHLGLAGFTLALAHSVWSLIVLPLVGYYLKDENLYPFLSALTALILYSIMALISNRYAIHELGGVLWRRLLRLGYIAYILTLIHFGLKGYDKWGAWFQGSSSIFPPLSLLIALMGVCVLILRIAVWVATSHKKTNAPPVQPAV